MVVYARVLIYKDFWRIIKLNMKKVKKTVDTLVNIMYYNLCQVGK